MINSVALIGNPNCGKTTLFNALTGTHQKVGNFAGVTVEKKEGVYKKDKSLVITDLPGLYSLSALSADEQQLIDDYRSLNEQGQEYIRQTMYMAKQTHKKMPDLSDLEKQA